MTNDSVPPGGVSFTHERLEVWRLAVDYAVDMYEATGTLPPDERFGLCSQLRRAALSISSNIAEGNGRTHSRDRVRFVEIANGSLMETVSQLCVASKLGFISEPTHGELRRSADQLARMLTALRRSHEQRSS